MSCPNTNEPLRDVNLPTLNFRGWNFNQTYVGNQKRCLIQGSFLLGWQKTSDSSVSSPKERYRSLHLFLTGSTVHKTL